MLISDTSMTLQSATGLPTATAITLTIDATDPVSGVQTPNLKEVVTGTLSGNVLSNLVRGQDTTTQQAHASGANVVMWWNANMINDFETSYLTQHKQLGTHTGITTDTLATSGNATVGGTLGVTGTTTHSGAVINSTTTVLTGAVSGAGYSTATISNPYKFSAVGVSQTFTPAGYVPGKIALLGTPNFDTGGNFDHTTNSRFTAPISGYYQFNGYADWFVVSGVAAGVYLYKNGSIYNEYSQMSNNTGGTFDLFTSFADILKLTAGDYIELWGHQGGGAALVLYKVLYLVVF